MAALPAVMAGSDADGVGEVGGETATTGTTLGTTSWRACLWELRRCMWRALAGVLRRASSAVIMFMNEAIFAFDEMRL